jgi:hypothetical protein
VAPTAASQAIGVATPPAEHPRSCGRRGWRWADLMRRVFAVDVLACARCGGRLRLIATLEASGTTRRILRHLALATRGAAADARTPPSADDWTA